MDSKDEIIVTDIDPATTGDVTAIDSKCAKCAQSICCNSINQKIDAPVSKSDFDHLLWQVSHKNINVFKDADGWYLHIYSNCEHLGDFGACKIYDTRPLVCREYSNDFCEYDEPIPEASEFFFENHKQLDDYCRKRFKRWDQRFEEAA